MSLLKYFILLSLTLSTLCINDSRAKKSLKEKLNDKLKELRSQLTNSYTTELIVYNKLKTDGTYIQSTVSINNLDELNNYNNFPKNILEKLKGLAYAKKEEIDIVEDNLSNVNDKIQSKFYFQHTIGFGKTKKDIFIFGIIKARSEVPFNYQSHQKTDQKTYETIGNILKKNCYDYIEKQIKYLNEDYENQVQEHSGFLTDFTPFSSTSEYTLQVLDDGKIVLAERINENVEKLYPIFKDENELKNDIRLFEKAMDCFRKYNLSICYNGEAKFEYPKDYFRKFHLKTIYYLYYGKGNCKVTSKYRREDLKIYLNPSEIDKYKGIIYIKHVIGNIGRKLKFKERPLSFGIRSGKSENGKKIAVFSLRNSTNREIWKLGCYRMGTPPFDYFITNYQDFIITDKKNIILYDSLNIHKNISSIYLQNKKYYTKDATSYFMISYSILFLKKVSNNDLISKESQLNLFNNINGDFQYQIPSSDENEKQKNQTLNMQYDSIRKQCIFEKTYFGKVASNDLCRIVELTTKNYKEKQEIKDKYTIYKFTCNSTESTMKKIKEKFPKLKCPDSFYATGLFETYKEDMGQSKSNTLSNDCGEDPLICWKNEEDIKSNMKIYSLVLKHNGLYFGYITESKSKNKNIMFKTLWRYISKKYYENLYLDVEEDRVVVKDENNRELLDIKQKS